MADETMASVPGLGPIAYTIPYYIKFATRVIEKAKHLKEKGSTKVTSPHLVEMALWSEYMLDKYKVPRKATIAPIKRGHAAVVASAPNKVTPEEIATPMQTTKGKTDRVTKRSAEPSTSVSAPVKKTKTTTPTPSRTTRHSL